VPLTVPDGPTIGTLCVLDTDPRTPTDAQVRRLDDLADMVVVELERRRTDQEEHEAQEARYRGVAESLPGAAYQLVAEPEGTLECRVVGERAEELLGISADASDFRDRFMEHVPASDRDRIEETLEAAIEQEQPWTLEVPFVTPEGERRWLLDSAEPDRRNGTLTFNGVMLDVTRRKQSEDWVQLQNDLLEQVLDGAPLEEILRQLVTEIEALRPDMLGSVLLYDESKDGLRHGAGPSLPDAYNETIDGIEIGPERGSCGTAIHDDAPVIAEDLQTDPRWAEYRDLAAEHGLRACWSVPIRGSEDQILGTFAMYYEDPGAPTDDDWALIEEAQTLVALAIERHRDAERLRLLSEAVEQSSEAVVITEAAAIDPPGPRIEYVNAAFEEMTGYDREELIGETPRLLQGPETDRDVLDSIRGALEAGEPWSGETLNYRKDGTPYTLRWSLAPVEGEDGTPEHWVSVQRDVTERREREQRLQEQRRKIETLYLTTRKLLAADSPEAVSDHIHMVLRDIFDYPLNSTAFVEDDCIVPEKTTQDERVQVPDPTSQPLDGDSVSARALRTGEAAVVHPEILDNDLDYADLQTVAGVPIGEYGVIAVGEAQGASFDAFDLRLLEVLGGYAALVIERIEREAELQSAKEEAEEAAQLKAAMLANMSHEIRTPLTSITGFAEILKEQLEGRARVFAEKVYRSGTRLHQTLDSVLHLSRLEAGAYDLDREPVDLSAVVEETVELLRPQADEKDLSLQVSCESNLEGQWSEAALNRILENLLENAIKFTPEGGVVRVRARTEGDDPVLTVEDTGIGISDEALPDIFQAFKQESAGVNREYEGTGLGLSIVDRLTEALGGTVDVETEEESGTRFSVRLPRTPAEGAE
jgi:PAS domain S-box-containing protein